MEKIKTVFIVGPTASGKTSLGVGVAKLFGGEVVSADSMQIYKHMDIATAKPTAEEMNGVIHHMIDFIEPSQSYSVAAYKEAALKCIYDISGRGKLPVVVGGTGLYVDALLYNIEYLDSQADETLRKRLSDEYDKEGAEKMWERLNEIDSVSAVNINKENKKKIIRALEIYYQTGKTLSEQTALSRQNGEVLDFVIIGLNAKDRNYLYDRINRRVDMMLSDGLLDEARAFFAGENAGTSVQAIGYKELLPCLKGEKSLEECVGNLKMQTRRYAKRQLTWFRRNENIQWLYIDENSKEELTEKAVKIIKERGII